MTNAITILVEDCVPIPRRRGRSAAAERSWRERIVAAARDVIPTVRASPPPAEARFTVEIDLFVASELVDLDNLAKPILDTIFRPGVRNPNRDHLVGLFGMVFPESDDSQVRELILRKVVESDPGNCGASIKVRWD